MKIHNHLTKYNIDPTIEFWANYINSFAVDKLGMIHFVQTDKENQCNSICFLPDSKDSKYRIVVRVGRVQFPYKNMKVVKPEKFNSNVSEILLSEKFQVKRTFTANKNEGKVAVIERMDIFEDINELLIWTTAYYFNNYLKFSDQVNKNDNNYSFADSILTLYRK